MSNPPDQKDKSTVERLPTPYRGTGTDIVPQDPLGQYLAEVRRYPLLTKSKRLSLLRITPISRRRQRVSWLPAITPRVKIAMEYRRAWVNVMDLIQEGNIGLAEAVKDTTPIAAYVSVVLRDIG